MNHKVSHSTMNDRDLWRSMKSGNREAFNTIYYTHVQQLIQYAHKFTSQDGLIDDCIQELFIDIWQKRERLSDTDAIKNYVFKALRRRLLRSLKSDRLVLGQHQDENIPEFQTSLDTYRPDSGEKEKALHLAFDKLSALQKEIIYLKYYNNLSFEEISDILQLEKKPLYNALSKAMIFLRKNLKKEILLTLLLFLNRYC